MKNDFMNMGTVHADSVKSRQFIETCYIIVQISYFRMVVVEMWLLKIRSQFSSQ